jgi:hypothetical protein
MVVFSGELDKATAFITPRRGGRPEVSMSSYLLGPERRQEAEDLRGQEPRARLHRHAARQPGQTGLSQMNFPGAGAQIMPDDGQPRRVLA